MIVRLLMSRVADKPSSPGWVTVLRSAGAHDTYLRTYRGALDAGRVVQFLLLDRLFPRSVFHALRQAEACLEQLDLRPTARIGAKAEALRLLGKARSDLEFLRAGRAARRPDRPARRACRRPSATSAKPLRCSTSTPCRGWRGPNAGVSL